MNDRLDLHAYLDGELSAAESAQVAAQLEANPELKREFESLKALKMAISTDCCAKLDTECWSACQNRIRELDRSRKAERVVSRFALPVAASLFGLILVAGFMNRGVRGGSDSLMISSAVAPSMQPAGSGQTGEFAQFLSRVKLDGAYSGVYEGRPVHRFDLSDAQGPFSLWIFEDRQIQTGNQFCKQKMDGSHCISWQEGRNGMMIAGPRSTSELEAVAKKLFGNR